MYDWASKRLLSECRGGKEQTLSLCWYTDDDGKDFIVTGGEKRVTFYEFKGRNMKSQKGLFGAQGKMQPQISMCHWGNYLVTGTFDGHLYFWKNFKLECIRKAYDEPVHAVHVSQFGGSKGQLYTIGSDGVIRKWSNPKEYTELLTDLSEKSDKLKPPYRVKSLFSYNPSEFIIGLSDSTIVQLKTSESSRGKGSDKLVSTVCMQGHYRGELWGEFAKFNDTILPLFLN